MHIGSLCLAVDDEALLDSHVAVAALRVSERRRNFFVEPLLTQDVQDGGVVLVLEALWIELGVDVDLVDKHRKMA